jgi:hypothetical protein
MGRVYGMPDEPGVLSGAGCRVFDHRGEKILFPRRVEFDADADEGMATVTATVTTARGSRLVDFEKNEECRVTFRTWVRLVHRGEPDPPHTPDVRLWKNADGTYAPGGDPIPQVPFAEKVSEVTSGA